MLGVTAMLAVSAAAATSASAGGNGAARSTLTPTTSSDMNDQCKPSTGGTNNGFAIVNAPGKPGEARFVNGEVSLKRGVPGAYTVWLVGSDGKCLPQGPLVTNDVGNGNAHLNLATTGGGTFYVVLQDDSMQEAYATTPVTVS
jgi:hypothetical protein